VSGEPEPGFVAETLAWCNELRAKDGKPPLARLPLGRRNRADSCPCGKATGWRVDEDVTWRHGAPILDTPPAVRIFIGAFDSGRLPQYERQ